MKRKITQATEDSSMSAPKDVKPEEELAKKCKAADGLTDTIALLNTTLRAVGGDAATEEIRRRAMNTVRQVLGVCARGKGEDNTSLVNLSMSIMSACSEHLLPRPSSILCIVHLLSEHLLAHPLWRMHLAEQGHLLIHVMAKCAVAIYDNQGWGASPRDRVVCAYQYQRLCNGLKQHGKLFQRTSGYVLSAMLCAQWSTSDAQVHALMDIGLFALLDVVDRHTVEMLAAQLPKNIRPILKHVNTQYTMYHKYKGVI